MTDTGMIPLTRYVALWKHLFDSLFSAVRPHLQRLQGGVRMTSLIMRLIARMRMHMCSPWVLVARRQVPHIQSWLWYGKGSDKKYEPRPHSHSLQSTRSNSTWNAAQRDSTTTPTDRMGTSNHSLTDVTSHPSLSPTFLLRQRYLYAQKGKIYARIVFIAKPKINY